MEEFFSFFQSSLFSSPVQQFDERHHDLCSADKERLSSDIQDSAFQNEVTEQIDRFVKGMGQVLFGIPLFFGKSLLAVGNFAYSVASSVKEHATTAARCMAYHAHKTGYVLINSEGTIWDGEIWDAKQKTDFVRELLTVSDENELAKLSTARELIGVSQNDDLTNLEIDEIVTKLLKSDKLPQINEAMLNGLANSILADVSRAKILDILSKRAQTPLFKIVQQFLDTADKGKQLTPYELIVVSILIEAESATPTLLKQKLSAKDAGMDLSKSDVNDAVKILLYELGKMPAVSDEAAEKHGDTLLSRENLSALLEKMPQTRLVEIARKFLDESSGGNKTKPLNINEWTIISSLADAIAAEQKTACKQSQRTLELGNKALQKLRAEYEVLYKEKYEKYCVSLKKENKAYQWSGNAENLEKTATQYLNSDQELQNKLAEIDDASIESDKNNHANVHLQAKLKIAEDIESLSFFAWNKLSHADGVTYLDKQTRHEFLPGYSKVKVQGVAVGVDFGLKHVIPGEPDVYAGARIGPTYTDNYFSDDENYLGHVTRQWNALASLLFKAGWNGAFGVSGNASYTHSFYARYAEWGTEHKRNVHQFHDKGRANSNNYELHGHHYDSQVNKFRDDPGFKPYLSRRARSGMSTDSYLTYYSWDEVTRIDEEKIKFDATENKKEGDMKAQLSLALTSTVHSGQQPADITKDKFHIRESFRENINREISELKNQRSRDIRDVERELSAIEEECIKNVQDQASQPNAIKDKFSELNYEINLFKINKTEPKEYRIERLRVLDLKLNDLDKLTGTDKFSEKIKPLIAELYIFLAEKVNEDKEGKQENTSGVNTRIEWIGKLFFELNTRKNETVHSRRFRLDVAIKSRESALWKNELKLDLLFKLIALNSQYAAKHIAQLVNELGLKENELPFIKNPANKDDDEARKLLSLYKFKLDYVDNQNQIHQVKLKRDFDIAALKREYAGKIADVHKEPNNKSFVPGQKKLQSTKAISAGGSLVDLTNELHQPELGLPRSLETSVDYLPQKKRERIKEEPELRTLEMLEEERDSKIREVETIAQLEEADIELKIKLASLHVQDDNRNKEVVTTLKKEYNLKKHEIAVQFKLQNLNQKHALDLATTERQCNKNSAHQDYRHAAEIRKAEKEIAQVELKIRKALAEKNPNQNASTITSINKRLDDIEKKYQLNEEKIEDLTLRNDSGIVKTEEPPASILELDTVIKQAIENTRNKSAEDVLKEVKENVVLKVAEFKNKQAEALSETELQRDLVFARLDREHAAEIRKLEKELKQAQLKTGLSFAQHEKESKTIQASSAHLEIEFEIDELRRQRDFDIETLSDEEILAMKWSEDDLAWIKELGPTLGLMKICDVKTKRLEKKLEKIVASQDPWLETIKEIEDLSRGKYQNFVKSREEQEVEKNKAELSLYKLEVELLIKLLPLQSETAVELRNQLIEKLEFQHLFTRQQLQITTYSIEDETEAQKIRGKHELNVFNVCVDRDRNVENISYRRALKENKETCQHIANQHKGIDKEKGKALYEFLMQREDLAKENFEKLKAIKNRIYTAPKNQNEQDKERIEKLAQAEKDKKAAEQAWAKEYASWMPVRNQAPVNFTNTDVEHNGAYLADYFTFSGSVSGSAEASTGTLGLSGALELSGKYRYTNLTREKFTFFCDMLGNLYKPLEEKQGIARLVNEQLNSEAPKTFMEALGDWWGPEKKPVSIKDLIIFGWKENNLFRYAPDAISKKPLSVNYKNGETRTGFSVDAAYFTVEHALRCLTQDLVSVIDLQNKMKSKDESLRKGTEEALMAIQKRYGAHNMYELVRHMSYFIGHLRVLSSHGGDYDVINPTQVAIHQKPTKEVIELQGKIKETEAMLFDRIQVEKEEYWRECGVEESQIVSVTLKQGVLKGKVGPRLGPLGSYITGSFRLEHFERRHVVHSRNANYFDITGAWGYLSGLASAIGVLPGLQDTVKDGWNHLFTEGVSSQTGNGPALSNSYDAEKSKTVRFHWLRRFEPLYKEFGYPMEWTPTYARSLTTTESKIGGELSAPLDKIMAIPVHPVFGITTTLTETKVKSEQWRGLSFNHFLMHYTHARDIGDLDRHTGKFLNPNCFWVNSRKNQHAGFAELFTSTGHQQWQSTHKKTPTLNELRVREVEFRRNSSLDPSIFRDFQRAKTHFLRVTKYYDVLHHAKERIAEVNREIAWLNKKNAEDSEKLPSGKLIIAEVHSKAKQQKREQKIIRFEEKISRISAMRIEAEMFFREKNKDSTCSLTDFAHAHCLESLEAMFHAYSPHDYSLLVNSPLYSAPTMMVNEDRKAIYNKSALMRAAKKVQRGTEQQKTHDREEFNYYDNADIYHRNMSYPSYLTYGFK